LGEGVVPLRKTIAGLREAGYNGDFDVELAGVGFEASGYHNLLAECRRTFRTLTPAMSKSLT
jgi:sugar phosphate isomerase/epimerase